MTQGRTTRVLSGRHMLDQISVRSRTDLSQISHRSVRVWFSDEGEETEKNAGVVENRTAGLRRYWSSSSPTQIADLGSRSGSRPAVPGAPRRCRCVVGGSGPRLNQFWGVSGCPRNLPAIISSGFSIDSEPPICPRPKSSGSGPGFLLCVLGCAVGATTAQLHMILINSQQM